MTVVNLETGEIVDESSSINYEVHPVAALFPFMTGEPFREFVEDIRSNGQRVPVVLDRDGRLIDGRNRARACQALGIDVKEERYLGSDVEAWIISHNIHRRHLTTSQRSMVAARLATLKHGSNRFAPKVEGSFEPSTEPPTPAPSIESAASQLNVARESVKRARAVIESGDDDLIRKVESGEVSVTAAAQQVRSRSEAPADESTKLKREERAKQIAVLAREGHRSAQIGAQIGIGESRVRVLANEFSIDIPADRVSHKRRRLDSNRVLANTASSIEAAAFSIQQVNPADLDQDDAQEWVDSLTESLSAIRKAVNSIKESLHV